MKKGFLFSLSYLLPLNIKTSFLHYHFPFYFLGGMSLCDPLTIHYVTVKQLKCWKLWWLDALFCQNVILVFGFDVLKGQQLTYCATLCCVVTLCTVCLFKRGYLSPSCLLVNVRDYYQLGHISFDLSYIYVICYFYDLTCTTYFQLFFTSELFYTCLISN